MNQIPYYNPDNHSEFNVLCVCRPHACSDKTRLLEAAALQRCAPTEKEYGQDLAGPKRHWNPLDCRIDDYKSDKSGVETPAKFVEMQSHEAQYANG